MIRTVRRHPVRFTEKSQLDQLYDQMHADPDNEQVRVALADALDEAGKPGHASMLRANFLTDMWPTQYKNIQPQRQVSLHKQPAGYTILRLTSYHPVTHAVFDQMFKDHDKAVQFAHQLHQEGAIVRDSSTIDAIARHKFLQQKKMSRRRPRRFAMPNGIVEAPNRPQKKNFTCWPNCVLSVLHLFGYDDARIAELEKKLGTSRANSTNPMLVAGFLNMIGLRAVARNNMTVADLDRYTSAGCPVIVGIQDYMNAAHVKHDKEYGHALLVIGVIEPKGGSPGYVITQDPSVDNVTEDSNSIGAPGKKMVEIPTFVKNWHDVDMLGNHYRRFGIAVCGKEDRV